MAHTAKGKNKLRARRERALALRREHLRMWVENFDGFGFDDPPVIDPQFKQAKIDRATEDIKHLERKLGLVKTKGE
jgi:hypothetical protein